MYYRRKVDANVVLLCSLFLDPVCSHFCALRGACSVEWVPRALVYLCVQVLDSLLVNYSYQVRFPSQSHFLHPSSALRLPLFSSC